MSKLFEEAIADAKKLKEVAEQNAKNKIIESISPVIKQMIEKEINDFGSMLFEEDEMTPVDSISNSTAEKPPISISGGRDLDVPMVDDNGKVTVDFEDLFEKGADSDELPQVAPPSAVDSALSPSPLDAAAPPAPEAPVGELPPVPSLAAEPSAVPPVTPPGPEGAPAPAAATPGTPGEEMPLTEEETAALTYENFSIKLDSLKKRLEESNGLSEVGKVYLKEQLLNLYGMLEKLAKTNTLPQKVVSLNENRLEVLYKKLKESKVVTIYNRSSNSTQKGQVDMAGLKKMATKLMEEAEKTKASSGFENEKKMSVTNPTEKTADKAGKHAMSATKPSVDTSDKSAPGGSDQGVDAMKPEEKFWNEEIARIEAELAEAMSMDEESVEEAAVEESHGMDSKGHMMTAAQEEPKDKVSEEVVEEEETVYEVDEKELAEAVRSIRKESLKRQMKALKEEYEELEEVVAETELDECGDMAVGMGAGMEDEMAMPGAPQMEKEDIVIRVSTDGSMDVEDPMGDEELPVEPHGDMDMDDMGMDMGMSMDHGDEDLDLDLDLDDEDEDEVEQEAAMPAPSTSPMPVKEGKKVSAKKPASKPAVVESKEVKTLKGQLAEQSLLTAKLIYLNKFLQRENLSRKQKQKIVEYLDNARTIEEAKEIYGRIKKVLDEATTTSAALGSSSKATKSGAATVNESATSDSSMISENRWMQLAGIKKRS
jgi:hypothetical protein